MSNLIKNKRMKIISEQYSVIDWDNVAITRHSGDTGFTWSRTYETGNIRIRLTEYSPGFKSDHWCCRGHIIHLLDGEVKFELKNRSLVSLIKGMSCFFSDSNATAHRPLSDTGAFLLIID